MKKLIGIVTLLVMSPTIFADEMGAHSSATMPSETQLLEPVSAGMQQSSDSAIEKDVMKVERSGFSRGSVVRSAFTREIEEREPMENLENLTNDNIEVKFFTELRDMDGQTAIHRWEYQGKVVAEIEFNVKGPRWRVWSSKSFIPEWTGEWKVSVINGAGEIISEKHLSYDVAAVTETEEPMTSSTESIQ